MYAIRSYYVEGAARYASEVSPVPIVNAGDGANQHPSQTMLDLYSIYKTQGTLENLNIYLVGDLKYGRTVHSLLMAMRHFNPVFHFIAPEELKMPEEYKMYCRQNNIRYVEHTDFNEEIIADADILRITSYNVCYTKLLRLLCGRSHGGTPSRALRHPSRCPVQS